MALPSKLLNSEWNQHSHYWVAVRFPESVSPTLMQKLQQEGWQWRKQDAYFIRHCPASWASAWAYLEELVMPRRQGIKAAIVGGMAEPDAQLLEENWKNFESLQAVAESLWLAEALTRSDVVCYLQPVVGANAKPMGYESFARVRTQSGEIIGGEAIIKAARALGIEFTLDRHLHVEAIKTFISSQVAGFLFINFFPGFIQRPEVYLEGLSEAARAYSIVPKHIVLDFTQSELPRDLTHLKKVTEYCRNRGYALALDDMESVERVKKLVPEIRPDFIKLDKKLTRQCSEDAGKDAIRRILASAHEVGALVIAEGVETEAEFIALKDLKIELFQGYYFSAPMPAEMLTAHR